MKVILSHEQADFDSLGAMLGAYLLEEDALPVLSRRLNRNVRAFLTLYGAELPFVDVRDLPNEPIEQVTLVDTQSLVTLRGMSQKTCVHVVDHHQPRPDQPLGWSQVLERLGACTTLFVENLQEHNGTLHPVHATLMLLGIYEDTGSLSYAGTTARDVRAAAFLLESGASLRIAAEYLNPPLSSDQRTLSDALLANAQTHSIHGQTIMIATADAGDMVEEISAIAHKLRDLLDPDALFLLVHTVEGIRLVARSTTDRVNVAEVAAHFKGGGHERAAAALIRSVDLPNGIGMAEALPYLQAELLAVLPKVVQPSVTVGQMMSRRPRLLSPKQSAQEAHHLMQRYGYEGYPVVEEGKVIGLLTRRAVDRALAHQLNLTVASLMEAGEVSITADDSLEDLQRLMTTSGWGQVPVVQQETGEVIGIVTRTDLIKSLAMGEQRIPGKLNFGSRLEESMPPVRLALLKRIAETARERHLAVYVVGGFVRDLILERPSLDFDVVVEGDAIALARSLSEHYGGRIVAHARFGTAKWWIADLHPELLHQLGVPGAHETDLPESLDLISARTEFYEYPTALPTVERGSIKLDLHRRDFTINTMALRLDGHHYGDLYDYWGGLNDLKRRYVRVLHSLSFVDDPTRMLRAVRFEQRFGFQIEDRTRQLIGEAAPLLRQVSGERLRHEFDLIFSEEHPEQMFARIYELGLFVYIHPALTWSNVHAAQLQQLLKLSVEPGWDLPESLEHMPLRRVLGYLTWMGQLPVVEVESLAERLRFSGKLRDAVLAVSRLWADVPGLIILKPSQISSRLDAVPEVSLFGVYCLLPQGEVRQMLLNYNMHWKHVQPQTTGHDLLKRGISPGPAYCRVLTSLRNAWLDGDVHNPLQEQQLLDELLKNPPALV